MLPVSFLALGSVLAIFAERANGSTHSPFYLKPGDRVCFYGDSITQQRFYGVDIETYVHTRFPNLHVKFVNSGVDADKVSGGWAGPIDLRLKRDVFPFKPNVVTIMLGMNDGGGRPFDQQLFDAYTNGYEHIIRSLQKHLPGVRMVLIEPSPYDDVTLPPKFPGGYNAVLVRYGAFVRWLAAQDHLMCVDFNRPLVEILRKAEAQNPALARQVIPGRVHPSAAGQLVMAQTLLKAWNAPATVTSVAIDAAHAHLIQAENTTVNDLTAARGMLSWTQQDQCLPLPVLGLRAKWWQFPPTERDGGALSFYVPPPPPSWDYTNAAAHLVVQLSHFYQALDQEPLQVRGLRPGHYILKINGREVGTFSGQQLKSGINLARYKTPMLLQAYHVLALVWKQVQWRFFAWRGIQTQLTFDHKPAVQRSANALITALGKQKEEIVNLQYIINQPKPTHYQLRALSGVR